MPSSPTTKTVNGLRRSVLSSRARDFTPAPHDGQRAPYQVARRDARARNGIGTHRPAFLLLALLLAASTLAGAQASAPDSKVEDAVLAEMKREHIPGLALGVYRDGQIVKVQGYGLANVELNVPVKPETIFQSGSVGKQFTATAIMMLVEEGKVSLDDSVTKYFPDAPASWKPIRVKNLLSHTSGLSEYETEARTKPGALFDLRQDHTETELFKMIATLPIENPPGERWAYRNTNYVLLGFLIHKVTGELYGDFLQERIFKPLGMNSTRIISEADIIPNRSAGYRLVKGAQLKNQDWVSPTYNTTADGAIYFNVLDLAKWDAALYTERLLKESSLDHVWTVFRLDDGKPNPGNYGFAWAIDRINGHRVIEHSGAWQGFTTDIARYVDDKLTVVVLTNLDSAHSQPGKIAHMVAGLYNPALTPPIPKPIEDHEPQVTAFVRQTVERLAAGQADPNIFAPEMRAQFSPEELKEAGEALKGLGDLKSLDLIERRQEDAKRHYRYRAVFGGQAYVVAVTLDANGKIAALGYEEE